MADDQNLNQTTETQAETQEGSNAGQASDTQDTTRDQTAEQSTQDTSTDSQSGESDEKSIEEFPEDAKRIIRELRNENARARVEAKQTAADEARDGLVKELGKLLGYESDDGEEELGSVEELTGQLTQERNRTKSAILELEIFRAAGSHNLDPNALLDSRNFMQQVESLDPSGKDFKDSLTDKLKEAAKDDRFVVQGQAPPRSTSELHSRRTADKTDTMSRSELADQVMDRLGGFTSY